MLDGRVGTLVRKPAYLATDPMTVQEGQQAIIQAVTDHWVKARGPGCPHVNLLTQQPFRFDSPRDSSMKDTPRDANSHHQPLPHWPQRGQDHNRCQRDQRLPSPWLPSLSLDCRFKSNRSSSSMTLSMSSMSDRSEGSWHSQCGRWHWEDGAHIKINLPVFKDEDAKDVVTYESWRWDLTVYQHMGCRDCTLLPYAIWSSQGYPGELVQSSSTDITLDHVLKILDKLYNNVKALDTLNQELFQLRMVDKETVSDWGVCLSRHLQVLAASFPDCCPPDQVVELKGRLLLWQAPQVPKSNCSLPEGRPTGEDLFQLSEGCLRSGEGRFHRAVQEPKDSDEQSCSKTMNYLFFLLWKLKGNQPTPKTPAMHLAHLEEEDAGRNKDKGSNHPDRIDRVNEEFMVHLVRAVKDTQMEEKCCYHCSSPEHFFCNCLLMNTLRENMQLNSKEGMASKKGAWIPLTTAITPKNLQVEVPRA